VSIAIPTEITKGSDGRNEQDLVKISESNE